MRRVCGLFTVLALAAATAVPAGAGDDRAEAGSSGELTGLLASSLERVGVPAAVAVSAVSPPDEEKAFPYLFPAGDLDADGDDDVVALSSAPAATPGGPRVQTVEARRGSDGTVLFRRDVPSAAGLVPVPARTGAAGQAGVLLVGYEQFVAGGSFNGSPGETPLGFGDVGVGVALEVVSLAGDGTVRWSRRYADGLFAYNGTTLAVVRSLPILGGLLTAPGSPTDVLVQVYDRAPEDAGNQADTLTTVVLDGAGGVESGRTVTDVSGARARVRAAPDLDGDGSDDYLVAVNGANDEVPDVITARRATTGAVLWSVPADGLSPDDFTAAALRDATGDGRSELALAKGVLPLNTVPSATAAVRVLDGASGAVLRTVPGQRADVVGDVDGDGALELLVSRVTRDAARGTADVRVVSARTGVLASGSVSVPVSGTGSPAVPEQVLVGDVDGDGAQDLALTLAATSVSTAPRVSAVFSGATAAVLRSTAVDGIPLQVSADGRGDDLYRIVNFGDSVRDVVVVDGLTGRVLRTVRLRPRGDTTSFVQVVSLASRGGRARLIAAAQGRVADPSVSPDTGRTSTDTRVVDAYVFDAADGTRRWQTDPDGVPPRPEFSGAATEASPYSWAGTARTGLASGSGGGVCAATDPQQRCERALVEVRGTPGSTGTLTVRIGQYSPVDGPVTDLDLRVLASDAAGAVGPELDSSARGALDDRFDEDVTVPVSFLEGQSSVWVLAEVQYYTSVETGYRGSATLTTR